MEIKSLPKVSSHAPSKTSWFCGSANTHENEFSLMYGGIDICAEE
jgi:hypothetical protein